MLLDDEDEPEAPVQERVPYVKRPLGLFLTTPFSCVWRRRCAPWEVRSDISDNWCTRGKQ